MWSYLRRQQIICASLNFLINPIFSWLTNREMHEVSIGQTAVDAAATCVIMSWLVGIFVTQDTRRFLLKQKPRVQMERPAAYLSRLPTAGWALGLILGLCCAAVVAPVLYIVLWLLRLNALAFVTFVAAKAVWTAAISALVARLVILRQAAVLAAPAEAVGG